MNPSPPQHIVVVENRAHLGTGHFPVVFAELANGFAAVGCRVQALTSRGWMPEPHTDKPRFVVQRYGRMARAIDALGERLTGTSREALHAAGATLRVLAMVGAARTLARRSRGEPTGVALISVATDPLLVAILAGPECWVTYQFGPPPEAAPGERRRSSRVASVVARSVARRRQGRDGAVRISTPNEACRAAWSVHTPFLRPVKAPIAGCRPRAAIPDARSRLGLDPVARLALVSGFPHDEKDVEVVFRAFAGLEEWRLVIAGELASARKRLRGPYGDWRPILIPGHLDDDTYDLVQSATDLVVLSFRPDHQRESGTLMDAISWGKPVVCSGRSAAAAVVDEHRLGVVFEPGDAESLAAAVRAAPMQLDPGDLARARAEWSYESAAARYLRAFGMGNEPASE